MSQRFVVGGQGLRKRPEYLEGISLALDALCSLPGHSEGRLGLKTEMNDIIIVVQTVTLVVP